MTGIEPAYSAWEADTLPLSYICIFHEHFYYSHIPRFCQSPNRIFFKKLPRPLPHKKSPPLPILSIPGSGKSVSLAAPLSGCARPSGKRKGGIVLYSHKVEISGINTSRLKTLGDEEKRELLKKSRAGDREAREKLIIGNLRLVLSIVQRFSSKRENSDDLFQVGCIGLMKAIDHFNTELDVKFSTYAVPMIIGEVRRYLRDNTPVRVSRSLRDLAYRSLGVREEILKKEQREPSAEEIALALGEKKEAVSRAMESIVEPLSLYDSVYSDGEDSVYVIDQLKDEGESEDGWIEDLTLREAMKKLGERERFIIQKRFFAGRTQMEIAEEIGISQAQVSRLEKSAIGKIKREF